MTTSAKFVLLTLAFVVVPGIIGCDLDFSEKKIYAGVQLQENVYYVSSRRPGGILNRQIHWLTQQDDDIVFIENPGPLPHLPETKSFTIFIHGYRGTAKTVADYFSGLIKYLKHGAGYVEPLIVYDWPSTAQLWTELKSSERMAITLDRMGRGNPVFNYEMGQYTGDGMAVELIGVDGLLSLIETLSAHGKKTEINIVAHSMGCYLVSKSLKKNPDRFVRVKQIFWLAPDITHEVLEDQALQKGLEKINTLHIYYSRNDEALRLSSNIRRKLTNPLARTPMLGLDGPREPDKVPANVILYDMTHELGMENVHAKYLTGENKVGHLIAEALAVSP